MEVQEVRKFKKGETELKMNKSKKEDLFFDLTNEPTIDTKEDSKQADAEKQICGICLDSLTSETKLDSCIHLFCYECIQKWSETANVCPMCTKKFHRLTKTGVPANSKSKKPKSVRVKNVDKRQAIASEDWEYDSDDFSEEEWQIEDVNTIDLSDDLLQYLTDSIFSYFVARDNEEGEEFSFISDDEEPDGEYGEETFETIDLTFEETEIPVEPVVPSRRRTLRPQLPPPLSPPRRRSRSNNNNNNNNEETLSHSSSSRRRTPITQQNRNSGSTRRSSRLAANRNRSSRSRTVAQKRNE